jgi:hypothetical protein
MRKASVSSKSITVQRNRKSHVEVTITGSYVHFLGISFTGISFLLLTSVASINSRWGAAGSDIMQIEVKEFLDD